MLYEKLKEKVDTLHELTSAGVVSSHWLRDLAIYEAYQAMNHECVYCRYELLAERFNLSSESIKKIVLRLAE